MFDKASPFDGMRPPSFAAIATTLFYLVLEGSMWTMFYAVYTETIGLMTTAVVRPSREITMSR